jgi:ferric-dicitrate binding protein FerR (iron transport regulator)
MNIPNHIDILIAKYLQGEALPNEAMELEDWCEQQSSNRDYFNQMLQATSLLDGSDWQIPPSVLQLPRQKNMRWKSLVSRWAVAAVFATLLGYTFWTINQQQGQVIVAGDRNIQHQLPDATVIKMSPGAKLTIAADFNKHQRAVALEGKANFEVVHDAHNPFTVDAGGVFIQDLGTKFTIDARPESDTLYVVVTEGIVRLYDDEGNEIIVKAGQSAWYIRSAKQIIASPETRVVRFDFDDTRLGDIVSLLGQTYQIKIELQPKEIADCKLTTQFFDEEIATIMTIVCETLNFSFTYNDQLYTIKGKPCQ